MTSVIFTLFLAFSTIYAEFIIEADESQPLTASIKKYGLENFVKNLGYEFEAHSVETDDGYTLEIHRISTDTFAGNGGDDRPPVLLWHGLLGSSADFFHIGDGKSLPLRLADEGYDVWVGNSRGNSWGRIHKKLNPDSDESFWDFSIDEPALNDIPATIDHILKTTNRTNLSYIGHSTGASQFFILTSSKPEYNDKVNVMAALAPVVYINSTKSILLQLVNKGDYPTILAVEKLLNATEVLPHLSYIDTALNLVCSLKQLANICPLVFFVLTGFDKNEITNDNVKKYVKSFPAGTSMKFINHFLQLRITGEFAPYDHGKIDNLDIYDDIQPTPYNLSQITVPVGIFYGKNDLIVTPKDVDRLINDLPNVVEQHLIDYKSFNHIDFLLADHVDSYANYYIINTLNKYNNKDPIKSTTAGPSSPSPTTVTSPPTTTAGGVGVTSSLLIVTSMILAGFYLDK